MTRVDTHGTVCFVALGTQCGCGDPSDTSAGESPTALTTSKGELFQASLIQPSQPSPYGFQSLPDFRGAPAVLDSAQGVVDPAKNPSPSASSSIPWWAYLAAGVTLAGAAYYYQRKAGQ